MKGIVYLLPKQEPSKVDRATQKLLEALREATSTCKAAGDGWAVWNVISELTALASAIVRETESR